MWWQPGDVLALDFAGGRYMREEETASLAAVLSTSRTSPATWLTDAGVHSIFGPNVPAITDRGLYAGGQATNYVPNNSYAGAVVGGSFPAGWTVSVIPGLPWSVAGLGTGVDGLPYIDVRISGTNTTGTTQFPQVNFTSGSTSPVSGNMIASARFEVLSATLAGRIAELNSDATALNIPNTDPAVYDVKLVRAFTVGEGMTYRLVSQVNVGVSINNLYRISRLQLETGSFASPPIVTAGAPATRLADSLTIPDFAAKAAAFGFGGGFAGEATVDLSRLSETAYRLLFDFGTDAPNRAYLGIASNNTVELSVKAASAGPVLNTAVLGSTGQYTLEWQVLSGNSFIKVNGNVAASSSATFTIPSLTTGYIGHSRSGGAHLNDPLRELHLRGAKA
ncbi:MAG: hypothetical protein CVT81_06810 [Alphaproteobacteria bacterium HGW-Alphaproteobacteria-3]|nr:MAG: hypothetical protein CVT81_06810 [Alphaproteobacteria bacterium HGW-Alphaproteobacteria-3]